MEQPNPILLRELKKALREKFRARMEFLVKISLGRGFENLIINYLRKYELLDILKLASAILSSTEPPIHQLFALKFFDIDFQDIIEKVKSFEELVSYLLTHEIYSQTLSKIASEIISKKSLFLLEAALKKAYYETLINTIRETRYPRLEQLEKITRLEIDIENCFLATAPYLYGYSPKLLELLVIEYPMALSLGSIYQALRSSSRIDILRNLQPYTKIVEKILDNKEDEAHKDALRIIKKYMLKLRIPGVTVGYIFYYIRRCEWEMMDLETILHGIFYREPPERIKANLVAFL